MKMLHEQIRQCEICTEFLPNRPRPISQASWFELEVVPKLTEIVSVFVV